ncbi:cytochrome P450 [Nocardia miyunensis]|uniref:cytochrome P450 n=1 Tax=Nocardia miyunensis TaxID=282684 RepID=UPI000B28E3D4|nr:cytochrome P450 [Nocardia miyunensis]
MPTNSPPAVPDADSIPIENVCERTLLHTQRFADDPHRIYRWMRKQGSMVPVELAPGVPATLVVGYNTALRILRDPERFPADPRRWQDAMPPGCPIRSMVEWRANALRSAGTEHERFRRANIDSLDHIDLHLLRRQVIDEAETRLESLLGRRDIQDANQIDVIADYARPLTFTVLNRLLGCTEEVGNDVAWAMARMFESTEHTEQVNTVLSRSLGGHIAAKQSTPGKDVTSRLIAHPTGLDPVELIQQLVTLYGAGIEPTVNLMANTLRLIYTDPRFLARHDGFLPIGEAVTENEIADPPMANYCLSYPPAGVTVDRIWLPAHQPVVISMASCNNDPAVNKGGGDYLHAGWGLAYSAGPHKCPTTAQAVARLIATEGTARFVDMLPDARPQGRLTWRPGPFHRALSAFPVSLR